MTEGAGDEAAWDFFVSYTQADRAWAEWIAWLLELDGYRVLVQAWDMVAGSNWISRMGQGVVRAARTVAVLSPDYVSSVYGSAEWQAAWADDPQGLGRKLITVRVRGDWPRGLLAGVVSIDLVSLSEAAARRRLRDEIAAAVRGRAKPGSSPRLPGCCGSTCSECLPASGQAHIAAWVTRRDYVASWVVITNHSTQPVHRPWIESIVGAWPPVRWGPGKTDYIDTYCPRCSRRGRTIGCPLCTSALTVNRSIQPLPQARLSSGSKRVEAGRSGSKRTT